MVPPDEVPQALDDLEGACDKGPAQLRGSVQREDGGEGGRWMAWVQLRVSQRA